MNAGRRLLVVLGCALCILLIASLFPAADPRIEVPGAGNGPTQDTQIQTDTQTPIETPSETPETKQDEQSRIPITPRIVENPAIPGRETAVTVDDAALEESQYREATLLVNGEFIGTVAPEQNEWFDVPRDAEELNLTVRETGDSEITSTVTDIDIETSGARAPGGELNITATIAGTEVPNSAISIDGEAMGTTNVDSEGTVQLPETAGETEIRVEKGPLSGQKTVEVQEPEIAVSSPKPFLLPGMPAHISVTAGGEDISGATVRLSDGSSTTTTKSGTLVMLPIADEVTVSAQVGEEETSTTISNLYYRTTIVVLVIPGLVIGSIVTYLRVLKRRPKGASGVIRKRRGWLNLNGIVLAIAGFFGVIGDSLGGLTRVTFPIPSFLRFRMPKPSFSLPTLSGPSVPSPSLGSLADSIIPSTGAAKTGLGSSVTDIFSSDDKETTAEAEESETTADSVQIDSETQLRRTWHRFIDQVGLRQRATQTPGEASRYAMDAGYPRRSVRRLLRLFRLVEYNDAEPSPDDLSEAENALDDISKHDTEDDDE
jgi:hypothetical protein